MLLQHVQIPIPEDEDADIEVYKENGMVYLKVGGKVVPTDVPAEGEYLKPDGSVKMTGNLQLNGNAIRGVKSISNTDSGMALESEVSLNNHKITDLLDPVEDQDAATKKYVDERSVLGPDGKIDSELDMNEHAIVNAHKISTDGPAPLYIGATIEDAGNNAPRLTATSQGEAAFVKASTQSTYVPVMVATPTQANHAANKSYVDTSLSGRVPTSRKVSGKALTADITLTAADVGALANTVTIPTKTSQLTNDSGFITSAPVTSVNSKTGAVTLTAADLSAVPTSRTVAGKPLSANVTLAAADVGAVPTSRKVAGKALTADITLTAADVSAVPTTRKVAGKALSADITLTAADVGALPSTTTIPTKTSQLTNDSNFALTTGATFTGAVSSTVTPTTDSNLTTKSYVDGKVNAVQASALLKSGGTMSGDLTLKGAPTAANMAATKAYVDGILPAFTADDNGKILGIVDGALAWVAKS